MLFRTVYGPELEAIYRLVVEASARNHPVSRKEVHLAFVQRRGDGELGSTQNVDDALSFLRSAGLIRDDDGFIAEQIDTNQSFRLSLLRALRRIEQREKPANVAVDPLYMLLLDELFIKPDHLFVPDVHMRANQLRQVKEVGGLSREKTQAWQRVMSFLGVGHRVAGGFQCLYAPDLIMEIANAWTSEQGTLQVFCEGHFGGFLPFARQQDGDLAMALQTSLGHLARQGYLELYPRQDSPSKPYFGERRLRGIHVHRKATDVY